MEYDKIDRELFIASAAPESAKKIVFQSLHDQIERALADFEEREGEVEFASYVAVPISMLYRLCKHYPNPVTRLRDVDRWEEILIGFLDLNAEKYHPTDADREYRKVLIANFARLRKALEPSGD